MLKLHLKILITYRIYVNMLLFWLCCIFESCGYRQNMKLTQEIILIKAQSDHIKKYYKNLCKWFPSN